MRWVGKAAAALLLLAVTTPAAGQRAYTLRAEARIGVIDGAGALTEPGAVAVATNGVVAVAQPQEALVRLFRPDGSLLRVVGRRGGGPGEFRAIVNMGFRGDSLWVTDPVSRRLSYFSMDGALLSEITWPGLMYLPDQPLSDGHFAASSLTRNGIGPVDPDAPWPIAVFSRDGTLLDTIGTLHTYSREFRISGRRVVSPIADGALSSLSPDGRSLAAVDRRVPERGGRGSYSITWISMIDGDTLGKQSSSYEAERMPREAIGQLVARMAGSGAPPEHVTEVRQVLNAQAFLPPVSRVVSGNDAVWLARESLGRTHIRWEHFAMVTGLAGFVQLPWKSRIVAARGEHIWVAEKDEFDVPYIVRYRLIHSSGSL